MDPQLLSIIEKAVRDGLLSYSGQLLLIVLLGAGAGAFLGSYLKKKGEQQALKEDFDHLLQQVRLQTEATERIKFEVAKDLTQFTQRMERRSEFEQYVLQERYKLISEFAHRLSRVMTDLNRSRRGIEVEGLFNQNDVVPLTGVFEDLAARSFQLSSKFHEFFYEQANVVLSFVQASTEDEHDKVGAQYLRNLTALSKMVNAEFGTEKISW